MRKILTAVGMVLGAFVTTWGLFHCWPEAEATVSWEYRGLRFGALGPIAVFLTLVLVFRYCFWGVIFRPQEPPSGPKDLPQAPVAPLPDPGTGPAADALREGRRFYMLGYQLLAIEKYLGAERLARKDLKLHAQAQLGIADSYSLLGENSLSIAYYEEARKLYQQEQDRLGEANVLRGLGDLESKLGQNEAAQRCYGEARDLYQSVGIKDDAKSD